MTMMMENLMKCQTQNQVKDSRRLADKKYADIVAKKHRASKQASCGIYFTPNLG